MKIDLLIKIAVLLAFITGAIGNLPKVLYQVKVAQLHLIQESQASKWGIPPLLK